MDAGFSYTFPAIRGIQAEREYYVTMCPMRLLPKVFLFNEDAMVPELRAQRVLNKGRLPEMANYVLNNRDNYVFSAITASLDGDVRFESVEDGAPNQNMGTLHVDMNARFIINDGQHRRAAIEMALKERPGLADETIAVVFFIDHGLERCQQMFADLNRHAVRPSTSLGVLYDHRDIMAKLVRLIVSQSPVFRDVVELERSSLALRSRKLFTLSAIYNATKALIAGTDKMEPDALAKRGVAFWEEVAKQIPEWQAVRNGEMAAREVREQFIHSTGIVLQAIGRAGNAAITRKPREWKKLIRKIGKINWRRDNARLWEGRAMSGGRLVKAGHHITLTTNAIKEAIGLTLGPDEKRVEAAFKRGEYAK